MKNPEQLLAKIEKLRKEMITVGIKKGLECSQVIEMSQRLDLLIFEFQRQRTDSHLQKIV